MAEKAVPPRGARLLAVSGQDDNFILYGNLTKTLIDDNWHNYQDFDRVVSSGSVVNATDGSKWLIGYGYRGDDKVYEGYIFYADRDATWYDLPTIQVPPPDRPAKAQAVAVAGVKVGLSFTAVSGAVIEIERALATAGPFVRVGSSKSGDSNYTDINLQPLTTYYYRLRASNDNGDSSYTDVLSVTTGADTTPTPTPTPTPTSVPSANTSTPTSVQTIYVPTSTGSSTQSTTQNPTKSWLENNLTIVLAGGGLLFVVLMVVMANRD